MPTGPQSIRLLAWLDTRPGWLFLVSLYIGRWVCVGPYVIFIYLFGADKLDSGNNVYQISQMSSLALLALIVVVTPMFETLVECALPYAIFDKVRNYRERAPLRPWGFIITSACIMVIFHPILSALVPAFITGLFLAYNYSYFAKRSVIQAIIATYLFHAAINIVGWLVLILS